MLIAKRYQARRYLPVTCGCIGVPVSKRYRARRHLPVDCRYRREGTGTVPSRYWQTVYGMYDTSPVGAGTSTILACLLGREEKHRKSTKRAQTSTKQLISPKWHYIIMQMLKMALSQ